MASSPLSPLEQYTLQHPQEVLRVEVAYGEGEQAVQDEILIFKGFSSSVQRPTPFDPDEPLVPPNTQILKIHRLRSPYRPDAPQSLSEGLTWEGFAAAFLDKIV